MLAKSFFGKGLEKHIFTKNGFPRFPQNYQHQLTIRTGSYKQFQTQISTFIHRKKVFQFLSKEFERSFKFQKCGKILNLWENFEFSTICTGPTITTKFYYTYNLYNAECKMQSAELGLSNSKYFQSKNRDIFEPKSKSFFGKGSGKPIFTKNDFPVKNTPKKYQGEIL